MFQLTHLIFNYRCSTCLDRWLQRHSFWLGMQIPVRWWQRSSRQDQQCVSTWLGIPTEIAQGYASLFTCLAPAFIMLVYKQNFHLFFYRCNCDSVHFNRRQEFQCWWPQSWHGTWVGGLSLFNCVHRPTFAISFDLCLIWFLHWQLW